MPKARLRRGLQESSVNTEATPSPALIATVRLAFDQMVDPDTAEIDWKLKRDDHGNLPVERAVIDALRIIKKYYRASALPRVLSWDEPLPIAGEWWVWDACRENEPLYLDRPGLGLSLYAVAGHTTSARAQQPRRDVPQRVRTYLGRRRSTPASRFQLARDAFNKIERYRAYCERKDSSGHARRLVFRFEWEVMTHPESRAIR